MQKRHGEEDLHEEVNSEETVDASFGDGIEDEICTEEEWRGI